MTTEIWRKNNLISLVKVMKSGGTPDTSKESFYNGEIPFVTIEDMSGSQKYLLNTTKRITNEGLKKSNAWLVPENSLLYSIYATLGLVRINTLRVATNQAILAMIVDDELIKQEYLYYWLEYIHDSVINLSSQTTQSNLSASAVKRFIVYHPQDKKEQEKIAEVLSTVDRAIAQTEVLIAKQQRIKTGLMQDLLTKGIDENGNIRSEETHEFKDSAIGRIPVEWDVKTLADLAEVDRGKFTHRPRNDPKFYGGDHPFIQTGDITSHIGRIVYKYTQTLNDRGTLVSKEFPKNTIAVTIAANIADTAILGISMFFPDSVVGVKVFKPNNTRFVEMMIRHFKPVLDGLAPQSAQKNINLEVLRPLKIPTPKPQEQRIIGELYNSLDSSQANEELILQKLSALKTGLMQDLLTGKVRVTPLLENSGGTDS
ncbi:restriction endonuclease subunit S [Laspinema sp. D1]|uniref:Restriction endonuclease subunit S n=1 Tax=Laspinema palackyanum D2a TaxID=2953684 RepID=A0ABT2MNJ3_9CYAN|nr:restriction endonuclease subunit S [Laspinema sp. D2a]